MSVNLMKKKVCLHDQIDEKKLIICAFILIDDFLHFKQKGR